MKILKILFAILSVFYMGNIVAIKCWHPYNGGYTVPVVLKVNNTLPVKQELWLWGWQGSNRSERKMEIVGSNEAVYKIDINAGQKLELNTCALAGIGGNRRFEQRFVLVSVGKVEGGPNQRQSSVLGTNGVANPGDVFGLEISKDKI